MTRVQVSFPEPSLTVQGFKDQCDLRKLMARFSRVADFAEYVKASGLARLGRYGDFSALPDYRSALDSVRKADESFMALPADVRSRFGDNPARFLDFVLDPKNFEEVKRMGLVKPASQPVKTGGIEGGAQLPT